MKGDPSTAFLESDTNGIFLDLVANHLAVFCDAH